MSAATLATVTASTKRMPAVSGGRVGAPATNLASVPVTPFQSLQAELAAAAGVSDPREAKVCHAFTDSNGDLYDIREGDVLVVDGTSYTIRAVAEFNRTPGAYSRLIVEEQKIS